MQMMLADWPEIVAAVAVGLPAVWWLFTRNRKPRERFRAPDALDAGVAPAQRNQAYIDAPKAVDDALSIKATTPILGGDDLTRIKGLGPKIAARLGELGVNSYAAIAAWDTAELSRIDGQLGAFSGRPARDNWIEQAQFLACDDVQGYEAKFGKL